MRSGAELLVAPSDFSAELAVPLWTLEVFSCCGTHPLTVQRINATLGLLKNGAQGAILGADHRNSEHLPSLANQCLFIRVDLCVFMSVQDLLLSIHLLYINIIMNICYTFTYYIHIIHITLLHILLSFLTRTHRSKTVISCCRLWSSCQIQM